MKQDLKYNFVETPGKFTIAELSIRKLGSSSVPIIMQDEEELKERRTSELQEKLFILNYKMN